ncbi:hypothetical protein K7I13_13570 [Brucepastera parasyntrophica]|uniref:hypothetical protein n=1 Tax=Brucepastera parasyntrophica TaxID=2880008 RepID=UPI00210AB8B7|nr:hypothetical protein [Brucepastera parasyntrophica]ULQ59484.1 hypothetical protein K7I13_13570 [Brucepastera parasyntrophica]
MNKKAAILKNVFLPAALLVLFFSCATSVRVQVTKPPLTDMSGVQRIAVAPFDLAYNKTDSGQLNTVYQRFFSPANKYNTRLEEQAAQALTTAVTDKLLASNAFVVISQDQLARAGNTQGGYASVVDAYLTGEINLLSARTLENVSEVSSSNDSLTKIYTAERVVTLDFTYRFIRADNGRIISQVTKSGTASDRKEDTDILNVRTSLMSELDLVRMIINDELALFSREIAPWTAVEHRYFEKDKTKDPRMKEADTLVKNGSYADAREIFSEVYAENGNFAAGYNAALLTELLGNTGGAIALMQDLYTSTGDSKAKSELDRMTESLKDEETLRREYSPGTQDGE